MSGVSIPKIEDLLNAMVTQSSVISELEGALIEALERNNLLEQLSKSESHERANSGDDSGSGGEMQTLIRASTAESELHIMQAQSTVYQAEVNVLEEVLAKQALKIAEIQEMYRMSRSELEAVRVANEAKEAAARETKEELIDSQKKCCDYERKKLRLVSSAPEPDGGLQAVDDDMARKDDTKEASIRIQASSNEVEAYAYEAQLLIEEKDAWSKASDEEAEARRLLSVQVSRREDTILILEAKNVASQREKVQLLDAVVATQKELHEALEKLHVETAKRKELDEALMRSKEDDSEIHRLIHANAELSIALERQREEMLETLGRVKTANNTAVTKHEAQITLLEEELSHKRVEVTSLLTNQSQRADGLLEEFENKLMIKQLNIERQKRDSKMKKSALRRVKSVMIQMIKGELAAKLYMWRTEMKLATVARNCSLTAAELKSRRSCSALKQLQIITAGIMRGQLGMIFHVWRIAMVDDLSNKEKVLINEKNMMFFREETEHKEAEIQSLVSSVTEYEGMVDRLTESLHHHDLELKASQQTVRDLTIDLAKFSELHVHDVGEELKVGQQWRQLEKQMMIAQLKGLQDFKSIYLELGAKRDARGLHVIATDLARDIYGCFGSDASELAEIWRSAVLTSQALLQYCDGGQMLTSSESEAYLAKLYHLAISFDEKVIAWTALVS